MRKILSGFLATVLFFQASLHALSLAPVRVATPLVPPTLQQFVRLKGPSPRAHARHVYLLQDVHMNEEAQRQMASALRVLAENVDELFVGVEGSSGSFDFRRYRGMADKNKISEISDRFLKEGRVGAVSYAGLTLSSKLAKRLRIQGLESPSLYSAHVEVYRTAVGHRVQTQQSIALAQNKLTQNMSAQPAAVKQLYSLRQAYFEGRLSVGAYVSTLSSRVGDAPLPLALETFALAFSFERALNFAQVQTERDRLLNTLTPRLSKAEGDALLSLSNDARRGLVSQSALHEKIHALLDVHHISLASTPAFRSYMQYLALSDAVDVDAVLSAFPELESKALAKLKPTPEQTKLFKEQKRLALAKKLTEFALTPEEWGEYERQKLENGNSTFQFLNLSSFERFYSLAEERNHAMALAVGDAQTSVLVVGGFHTPGLTALLQQRGITVSVLTPRLSKIDATNGASSLSYFLKEKSPLENLFAGRKLFLGLPEGIGPITTQSEAPRLRVEAPRLFAHLAHVSPTSKRWVLWGTLAVAAAAVAAWGHPVWGNPFDFLNLSSSASPTETVIAMGALAVGAVLQGARNERELEEKLAEYNARCAEVVEACKTGDAAAHQLAVDQLLAAARETFALVMNLSSSDAVQAIDKAVARKKLTREYQWNGGSIPFPAVNGLEILHLASGPDQIDDASKTEIQRELDLVRRSFHPDQQKNVADALSEVEIRSVNGPDLIAVRASSIILELLERTKRNDETLSLRALLLEKFFDVIALAQSSYPDHFQKSGARETLSLKPRPDNLDLLITVALHEIGHALQSMGVLEITRSSEIFTEAITMQVFMRRRSEAGLARPSANDFARIGKDGAEHFLEMIESDGGALPSLPELVQRLSKVLLDHPSDYGVKSQSKMGELIAQSNFMERQLGLYLGLYFANAAVNETISEENPWPALRRLIAYTQTEVVKFTEASLEPTVPKTSREVEAMRASIQSMAREEAQLPKLDVKEWHARSMADKPRWRLTIPVHGVDEVPVLEVPETALFSPDESLVLCEAAVQGRSIVETSGVVQDADMLENLAFQLLLGSTYLLKAESFLKNNRRNLDFERRERRFYPNPNSPGARERLRELPLHLQYIEAMLYETRRGEIDPRINDADVTTALNNTRHLWKRLWDTASLESQARVRLSKIGLVSPSRDELQRESAAVVYAHVKSDVWPVVEKLFTESYERALAEEVAKQQKQKELQQQLASMTMDEQQQLIRDLLEHMTGMPQEQVQKMSSAAQQAMDQAGADMAPGLGEAGAQASQAAHDSVNKPKAQQELGQLLKKIKELTEKIPGLENASEEVSKIAAAIQSKVQDIERKLGEGKKDAADGQTLADMIDQLASAVGQLSTDAKSTAGKAQNIAGEAKDVPGSGGADVPNAAGTVKKVADEIQSATDELAGAADKLNDALNDTGNHIPQGKAQAQAIDGQAGHLADETKNLRNALGKLESALGKLGDDVTSAQSQLDGKNANEGTNDHGEKSGKDGSDSSSDASDGLDGLLDQLQGQLNLDAKPAVVDTEAERKQRAANMGITLDQLKWWDDFKEPISPVISTLQERFAASLRRMLKKTVVSPVMEGDELSPEHLVNAFTGGPTQEIESLPKPMSIDIVLIMDVSGSMFDKDYEQYTKFYQTLQSFAAVLLALERVQAMPEWRGRVKFNVQVRGFASAADIPTSLKFDDALTEPAIFQAVQDLRQIEAGGTADVVTLQAATKALKKRAEGKTRHAGGVLMGTDGNTVDVKPHMDKILESEDNKKVEFLIGGVGDGEKIVMQIYHSEDPKKARRNVHVFDVDQSVNLFSALVEKVPYWFERLVSMATGRPVMSILFLIGGAMAAYSWWNGLSLADGTAQWASVPFIAMLGRSFGKDKPVYEVRRENEEPVFVLKNKYGKEVKLPVRTDTYKTIVKSGADVEWKLERHRIEARHGDRVMWGEWMGTQWRWYQRNAAGEVIPLEELPVGEWPLSIKDDKVIGKDAAGNVLFEGDLQAVNSVYAGELRLWSWKPSAGVKTEIETGSFVPLVKAVLKNGSTLNLEEAAGRTDVRPDVVELTVGGVARRIYLHDPLIDRLTEMMLVLGQPLLESTNLALVGHKGTGKDMAIYLLAGFLRQPVRTQNTHKDTTEYDLKGRTTIGLRKAGTTDETLSEAYRGGQLGDWVIIDEITKMDAIEDVTSLNLWMQSRHETFTEAGRIAAKPSARLIFTWNPPGALYEGQNLNIVATFLDRLGRSVKFAYPDTDFMTRQLMESVFGDMPETTPKEIEAKQKMEDFVRRLASVARETQIHADTEQGKKEAIPPCDFRQLRRTLKHVRAFPKDMPYLREIFKLDYSPVFIPREYRDAYMSQVDKWFDKHFGAGQFAQKMWDANGDPLVDPGWPRIDEKNNKVVFGNPSVGEVELALGELPVLPDDLTFLDTPANRVILWMMAKDEKLGFHNGLLGEKGAGKSALSDFFFDKVLHRKIERTPPFTNRTKGTVLTGKPGLKDAVTHFPRTAMENSMNRGVDLLVDEATDGAAALAALNNPLEFGFVTMASGKEVRAAPGWRVTLLGNLPEDYAAGAKNLSAELGSRFRFYLVKAPSRAQIEHLLRQDIVNRIKPALRNGQTWTDLSDETIGALADAYLKLVDAKAQNRIFVPVSYRSILKVAQTLGLHPEYGAEIEDLLVNSMVTSDGGQESARPSLWPVAGIRYAAILSTLQENGETGISDALATALRKTFEQLARKSKAASPMSPVKVTVSGTEKSIPPFSRVPTNEDLQKVLTVLIEKSDQMLDAVETGNLVGNALGCTTREEKWIVAEAVLDSQLADAVAAQAWTLAQKNLEKVVHATSEKLHLHPTFLEPLLKLVEDIVSERRSATLTSLPTPSQIEKMMTLLKMPELMNLETDSASSLIDALGLPQEKSGPLLERSGLLGVIADAIADEKNKAPSVSDVRGALEYILAFLKSFLPENATVPAVLPVPTLDLHALCAHLASAMNVAPAPAVTATQAALLTVDEVDWDKFAQLKSGEVASTPVSVGEFVKAMALSPDGKRIVLASQDSTVRLLDAETGVQIGDPLRGHTQVVTSVAFSPDGKRIVSGSWDNTVRMWDAETGGQIGAPLRGHTDRVSFVAFSPDGKRIVSKSWDNKLRLWDAETGGQIGDPLPTRTSGVNSFALSPDGKRIVLASRDNTVRLWDAETGVQIGDPLRGHTKEVNSVAFSPDGKRIVSGSWDNTVRMWDAETGGQIGAPLVGHTQGVNSVAFSPDGKQIVSGSRDTTVLLWDTETGVQIGDPLRGHTQEVHSVAFSPDGKRIVSGSGDGTICMWDLPLKSVPSTKSVATLPAAPAVVPNASFDLPALLKNLATSMNAARMTVVKSGSDAEVPHRALELGRGAISPDGNITVSFTGATSMVLKNRHTGAQIGSELIGHTAFVQSVLFGPSSEILASIADDHSIRVWNAQTGSAIGSPFPFADDTLPDVVLSPDNRRLAIIGQTSVQLWDVQSNQAIGDALPGESRHTVVDLQFSADGRSFMTLAKDGAVKCWDSETAAVCWGMKTPSTVLMSGSAGTIKITKASVLAQAPNEKMLLLSGSDGALTLLGTDHLTALNVFPGHGGPVTSASFSSDSQLLLVATDDKIIRLWNVKTGKQVGPELKGHDAKITSVKPTPDGQKIISTDESGRSVVWDFATVATPASVKPTPAPTKQPTFDLPALLKNLASALNVAPAPAAPATPAAVSTVDEVDWETISTLAAGKLKSKSISAMDKVLAVAFSPDGKRIVSGSQDNTVRLWDAETGVQIGYPLSGHTEMVFSVAFSPDGKRIVSGSQDNTVRLWDAETGAQIGVPLSGHADAVLSVAFSADGKRIVSGSTDKTVRLWDAETGVQIGSPLIGHIFGIHFVAFSPDGKRIVSGSADSTVRLWDAETGVQIGNSLTGHTNGVTSVAFSPDGKRIVSGSNDETVRLWNAETEVQIGNPLGGHIFGVHSVAFSPDGKRIVSGSADNTVRLWDAETGVQIGNPLSGHTGRVYSVVFSPDGKQILSGSIDKTVRLWDLPLKSVPATTPVTAAPAPVAVAQMPTFDLPTLLKNLASALNVAPAPAPPATPVAPASAPKFDWKNYNAAFGDSELELPEYGQELPMRDGSTHVLSDATMNFTVSSDEKTLLLNGNGDFRGPMHILEFARNPTTGELSDGRVIIESGRPVPGMPDKVWNVRGFPTLSPDGKALLVGVVLDGKHQIFFLSRDPVSGELSDAHVLCKTGDAMPGSKNQKWDLSCGVEVSVPVFSPDGASLLVKAYLSGGLYHIVEFPFDYENIRLGNGRRIFSDGKSIKGLPKTKWKFGAYMRPLMFSPDGTQLFIKNDIPGDKKNVVIRASRPSDLATAVPASATNVSVPHIDVRRLKTEPVPVREIKESSVQSVQYSPDGKWLAMVNQKQDARRAIGSRPAQPAVPVQLIVYDRSTGAIHWQKDGLDSHSLYTVDFSPDSKQIAVAGNDGTIIILNVEAGQEKQRLSVVHSVRALKFNVAGNRLASQSGQQVDVWDLRTGNVEHTFRESLRTARELAYSPDGKWLAFAGDDNSIRLWDTSTDPKTAKENSLVGANTTVRALAFSPDGKTLVSGHGKYEMRVWDVASRREIRALEGHLGGLEFGAVAFSADGRVLASATMFENGTDSIHLWDTQTWKLITELKGHQRSIRALSFSQTDGKLASGSYDATIREWDLPLLTVAPIDLKLHVSEILSKLNLDIHALIAFVEQLLVTLNVPAASVAPKALPAPLVHHDFAAIDIDALHALDPNDMHTDTIDVDLEIDAMAMSPDGSWLVVSGEKFDSDGTSLGFQKAIYTRAPNGKWSFQRFLDMVGNTTGLIHLAFSSDSKHLATISSLTNNQVQIWDVETGNVTKAIYSMTPLRYCAFRPGKNQIATVNQIGNILVWDLDQPGAIVTQALRQKVRMTQDPKVGGLTFSPDGTYVVSSDKENEILVWEVDSTEEVELSPKKSYSANGSDPLPKLAYSADGRRFIAVGTYGAVHFWDVSDSDPSDLTPAGDAIYFNALADMAVSGDGSVVALSVHNDGVVLVRPAVVVNGDLVDWEKKLPISKNPVWSMLFAPDGHTLLTASEDKAIRVWTLPTKTPGQTAETAEIAKALGLRSPFSEALFTGIYELVRYWVPFGVVAAVGAFKLNDPALSAVIAIASTVVAWALFVRAHDDPDASVLGLAAWLGVIYGGSLAFSLVLSAYWPLAFLLMGLAVHVRHDARAFRANLPAVQPVGLSDWGYLAYEKAPKGFKKSVELEIVQVRSQQQINDAIAKVVAKEQQQNRKIDLVLLGSENLIHGAHEHVTANRGATFFLDENLLKNKFHRIELSRVLDRLQRSASHVQDALLERDLQVNLRICNSNWDAGDDLEIDGQLISIGTLPIRVFLIDVVVDLLRGQSHQSLDHFFRSLHAAALAA